MRHNPKLAEAFARVVNKYSAENESNTPDFILGEYLLRCLEAFEDASNRRERWYGYELTPGQPPRRIMKPGE